MSTGSAIRTIGSNTYNTISYKQFDRPSKPLIEESARASPQKIEKILRSRCHEEREGVWDCHHLIGTFYAENWTLSNTAIGWPNKNGSYDYGICQVNSQHKGFFNTDNRKSIERQVSRCIGQRNDAFKRNIHPARPWKAYRKVFSE